MIEVGEGTRELFSRASDLIAQQERVACELAGVLAGLVAATPERQQEFVGDELALLWDVHPVTARCLVDDAVAACRFPALYAHWQTGQITGRQVKALVGELDTCTVGLEDRDLVQEQIVALLMARADKRGRRCGRDRAMWPRPGALRRETRAAVIARDPQAAARRERRKRQDRCVAIWPTPDGQAGLSLEGPQDLIGAAYEAVRARATALPGALREGRTRAQVEFDLAVELLISGTRTGTPQAPAVELQVLVPLETLTGHSDRLGEQPGLGPVTPVRCRELAAQARWMRRILTRDGAVIAVDGRVPVGDTGAAAVLARFQTSPPAVHTLATDAYRPTDRLTRLVRLRDQTCRFPGCTRRAAYADLDHRRAWPHGPTHPDNLWALCRHHHRAKQSGLFRLDENTGHVIWTSLRTHAHARPDPPALTAD